MAIQTQVSAKGAPAKFPALRVFTGEHTNAEYGPLVVLFTDETHGVALSGVTPGRVGISETWVRCDDSSWKPASITLGSVT